jgi:hypothetical protein
MVDKYHSIHETIEFLPIFRLWNFNTYLVTQKARTLTSRFNIFLVEIWRNKSCVYLGHTFLQTNEHALLQINFYWHAKNSR